MTKMLNKSDQKCHNTDEFERKKSGEKKDSSTDINSIYRYKLYPYMKDYCVY